jgi:plastocyanin
VAAAGAFNASKLAVFSTQDHATPSYVRNATLWCSGYNWTGVSPWNSADANKRAGTLVSPRSFIHAAHYPIAAGTDVRFVAADGTVHTRTVVTSSKVGSTDIQVANLDSDLPSTIAFYAVLPSTWRMNLPNCHFGIPTVMFDQEEKALIGGLGSSPAGHIVYGSSLYLTWTEPLITGDSGNPVFLLINGAPVLVTTHTTVGGGPDLSANVEDINAILAPTGHQLTIANLSGFALT